MNIYEVIREETASFGNKTAVIDGAYSVSYAELLASSDELAPMLKEAGVKRYDRVALLCCDSAEYIIASLSLLSIPAVVVPVSAEHTEDEIQEILERMSADWLFFESGVYGREGGDEGEKIKVSRGEFQLLGREGGQTVDGRYYEINPAFIRFSSGTTGTSKGIVLSHEAIYERTSAADRGLHITQDDTVLWVLSMSFHFVVTILLFLRRAATIVLCGRPFPEALVDGIRKMKGTFIYASPFHYNLLAGSDLLAPDSMRNIRMAVSTAMKLPANIAEKFCSVFGLELTEAYGIIEVGLPFINLSVDRDRRSSVGRALPGYEVDIVNRDVHGTGEIHIRGAGMLDAYFSPWQGRESILHNGWFHTGDLGSMDEDGYLTIAGRDKEVINFTGMKVFPHEVESVINIFPGVRESLVYVEDHPQLGQLPAAKVVLQDESAPHFDPDDLRKFCYKKLAQYKVPKVFEIVCQLKKTASGKIRR